MDSDEGGSNSGCSHAPSSGYERVLQLVYAAVFIPDYNYLQPGVKQDITFPKMKTECCLYHNKIVMLWHIRYQQYYGDTYFQGHLTL